MTSNEAPVRERVRAAPRGPAVLAAMLNGVPLSKIAEQEGLKIRTVEKLASKELRKRWIAPAKDFARLQIARLEGVAAKVKIKAERGDLPAIDRYLKIMDRLDRYHGFTKLAPLAEAAQEDVRPALLRNLNQAADPPENKP